jgi:hypothetical protein
MDKKKSIINIYQLIHESFIGKYIFLEKNFLNVFPFKNNNFLFLESFKGYWQATNTLNESPKSFKKSRN